MVATPPTNSTSVPLDKYMASQVADPTLSTSQTFTPALLGSTDAALQSRGELMSTSDAGVTMAPATPLVAPATQPVVAPIQQTVSQPGQVNSTAVQNSADLSGASQGYTAAQTGNNTPQAAAQQGMVDPLATIQGQLTSLYAQTTMGQVPTWAAGAVTTANAQMAARGMGASSIGAAAITAAVQQSALPIAAQDASTYFQMDLTNLSNRQQTELANVQMQQQGMLSDQAAVNAANQFNASNYTQLQEFTSTLVSNIASQNADRFQAMSQFNAGQANTLAAQDVTNQMQVSEFSSTQRAAIDQFNASQQFARDQFNAQAAYAIDQSNVLWRRNLNTENTAAINAANQVNVQNAFNMSQTAQNNLWQHWRDTTAYAFSQSQNQAAMNFNAAMAANNQAFASPQTNFNWAQAAGSFATSLLT